MSFDPRDYESATEPTKCSCGQEYHPEYILQVCGHPGCAIKICPVCAILCVGCGKNLRCDEHAWRTTYSGSLSRPIQVCDECRNEELDEIATAKVVSIS